MKIHVFSNSIFLINDATILNKMSKLLKSNSKVYMIRSIFLFSRTKNAASIKENTNLNAKNKQKVAIYLSYPSCFRAYADIVKRELINNGLDIYDPLIYESENPVKQDIEETLRVLAKDPFAPQLGTHKLRGKLSGCWACSLGYNFRIVFDFVKSEEQTEDDIFLIEIGTHDEVY